MSHTIVDFCTGGERDVNVRSTGVMLQVTKPTMRSRNGFPGLLGEQGGGCFLVGDAPY